MKLKEYHSYQPLEHQDVIEEYCIDYLKQSPDVETKFGIYSNPIGIEIELENFCVVKSIPYELCMWQFIEDSSLKIMGRELVSYPMSGRAIDVALDQYKGILNCLADKPDTGHRCSIHVHVNVRELTQPQLTAFVASYACLEQLFFSLVKDHRKGNSYCYPLTDLHPDSASIMKYDPAFKYCAFNTDPVLRYGTVEFRHFHATTDIKEITRWLQLICKLYKFVANTPPLEIRKQIMRMNSLSTYSHFVDNIFLPLGFMFDNRHLQELMEDEVAWAKQFLLANKHKLTAHFVGDIKKGMQIKKAPINMIFNIPQFVDVPMEEDQQLEEEEEVDS
jgi:hypothetical protein